MRHYVRGMVMLSLFVWIDEKNKRIVLFPCYWSISLLQEVRCRKRAEDSRREQRWYETVPTTSFIMSHSYWLKEQSSSTGFMISSNRLSLDTNNPSFQKQRNKRNRTRYWIEKTFPFTRTYLQGHHIDHYLWIWNCNAS